VTITRTSRWARALATCALAAGMLMTSPGAADAAGIPPDVNSRNLSWPVTPCYDGLGGVVVANAVPTFTATSFGWYTTNLYLITASGKVLAYTRTDSQVNVTRIPAILRFKQLRYSSSYTGEVFISAYVYKWNGSAYALYARRSLNCA